MYQTRIQINGFPLESQKIIRFREKKKCSDVFVSKKGFTHLVWVLSVCLSKSWRRARAWLLMTKIYNHGQKSWSKRLSRTFRVCLDLQMCKNIQCPSFFVGFAIHPARQLCFDNLTTLTIFKWARKVENIYGTLNEWLFGSFSTVLSVIEATQLSYRPLVNSQLRILHF